MKVILFSLEKNKEDTMISIRIDDINNIICVHIEQYNREVKIVNIVFVFTISMK